MSHPPFTCYQPERTRRSDRRAKRQGESALIAFCCAAGIAAISIGAMLHALLGLGA